MLYRYVEGVEVLYTTNTLHILTERVSLNPLAPYIPAPHLASIKSLEWVVRPGQWEECWPADTYVGDSLSTLRIVLPNLQRLYIGFCPFIVPQTDQTKREARSLIYTERILKPLDMLVGAGFADGLREIEIGVPASAFRAHRDVSLSRGHRAETEGGKPGRASCVVWGPSGRIWRPVGTRGYWLQETGDDRSDSGWSMTCFEPLNTDEIRLCVDDDGALRWRNPRTE